MFVLPLQHQAMSTSRSGPNGIDVNLNNADMLRRTMFWH
jgi:hypothetical protein